jgi:DNA gyrase/topoisomerase IV subunit B
MHLLAGGPYDRFLFGAILNALSERLVVSTMRDGQRYRMVFAKGMLVTLLQRVHCQEALGTTWFTFHPDPIVVAGDPLTSADMQRITTSAGRPASVPIRFEDRSGEEADWF